MWLGVWMGVLSLVGSDAFAKKPRKRPPRARSATKKTPPKGRSPKRRARRTMKLPFSFRGIKLPSNRSPLMNSSAWRGVKAPPKGKKQKRKRVPLRRIKMSGKLSLRTQPNWRTSPSFKGKRKWVRARVQVQDPSRLKTGVRLVVYRRWLGRHGWNLRWQGHVYIPKPGKWRLHCPRKRFCFRLRREIRQILRARPKRLSPRLPQFAWRLRRALERARGYEIDVQTR